MANADTLYELEYGDIAAFDKLPGGSEWYLKPIASSALLPQTLIQRTLQATPNLQVRFSARSTTRMEAIR